MLRAARTAHELEGVVLLHQDTEILDARFLDKLREEFADPDVWLAGVIGGLGVRKPAWWESYVWCGRVLWDPHPERGRSGHSRGLKKIEAPNGELPADADMLDGLLLVLSAGAARALSFDERLGPGFHGYDSDICLQARSRGKRVRVCDLDVVHHTPGDLSSPEPYRRAHVALATKWGL